MVAMIKDFSLNKIYQILLIILAFLMPLTVFGANLIIVIICLIWLLSGDYKSKYSQIVSSKLLLASIFFFSLHVIGLFWTEDISWGLHIVHKMWYFLLLFPALFTIVRKEYIKYYVSAFLLAITITEIASYLIWFEVIEPFKNATVENPTPFMSHISYNPILTFAAYLVLHELLFNKKITKLIFTMYSFFAISMSINMFITGGRAGQVVFFVMIAILIFQFFDRQRIKSLIIISILLPAIFFSAYQASDIFRERAISAFQEAISFSEKNNTSVGLRINMAINSWYVIKNNSIIGAGTGDFPRDYSKVNKMNSPELPDSTNPHNMYILILVELGLIGLMSMLSIFYYQIKLSYNSSNKFIRDVGLALPLIFLVLMLSDSYLLGHYTTLMFVFFGSFLYKDFEKN